MANAAAILPPEVLEHLAGPFDWSECIAVERNNDGWCLRGYPHISPEYIVECLQQGLNTEDIAQHFNLPQPAFWNVLYFVLSPYVWIGCRGVEQDGDYDPLVIGSNIRAWTVIELLDSGLSYEEIAKQLSLPEDQVRSIVEFRRPLLPDEHGYDWAGCEEVVQIRGMMGGLPSVKGHRIAASQIAELFKDGYSPALICNDYILPLEQVRRILKFAFPKQSLVRKPIDWSGCRAVERYDGHLQRWAVKGTQIDPDMIVELSNEGKLDRLDHHDIAEAIIHAVLEFASPQLRKAD